MTQPDRQSIEDIEVDLENLYREETFTDLRIGSIRRLSPVKPDGAPDPGRKPLYTGETTIMSQAGPLPLSFSIEATSLEDACRKLPQAMKGAVENLMDEAAEVRRREASRLVTPDELGLRGGLSGLGPGGATPPGTGQIRLP
ncbi:MAG: hypothetical protein ACE5EF_13185 [Dehalococcoidia bacterium]